MNKKRAAIAAAACVLGAATAAAIATAGWHLAAGAKGETAPAKKKEALVSLVTVELRDLPIRLAAQGHLVALNQVDIRPQVGGIIRAIHFQEGQQVGAGQLLFTLDASDAGAQLARAEAGAAQVRVQLDDARREARRAAELVASHYLSTSAADTSAAKVDNLEAQARAAQADVRAARLLLARFEIRAPISAKAGAVNVHPGSLAQPTAAEPLVTLAQFDPIGVEFSLPEQDLPALLAAQATGPVAATLVMPSPLPGQLPGQDAAGELSFINHTVNRDTGSIGLKARFPNRGRRLWPGAFGQVSLAAGVRRNVAALPPQSVREGPDGRFVYLVGADRKVAAQPVTLIALQDRAALVTGLRGGESVVLDGDQNLRPGALAKVAALAAAKDNDKTAAKGQP